MLHGQADGAQAGVLLQDFSATHLDRAGHHVCEPGAVDHERRQRANTCSITLSVDDLAGDERQDVAQRKFKNSHYTTPQRRTVCRCPDGCRGGMIIE